ncbi:long-chain fatty acid--CoA ligase [Deinococcus aquiradiocola]|uniref:Long-chain-fatty-acid--CoA ligase n=1 Tax=Deinococcus aquiradiocola TaxID=393059 RepID=A0A917PLN8_9DEIO|nr:long-chain fatty acid--CoA ligase [Deinococcus aquiradiocola]GGJ83589.1 long-chain-fatty-acid--CoA ligase [Deinococcus aquiradiocola]
MSAPLFSSMMDVPLVIPTILDRLRTLYYEREVVSLVVTGKDEHGAPVPGTHRTTYGDVARRALQLANALQSLGVREGDRVATLAVNSYRHLECYLGIPSMGAVLHTVNIRLHPDQVAWILNHAEDRVLIVENLFAGMVPALRAACPQLEHIIVMGPHAGEGDLLDYDDLIGGFTDDFTFPDIDERQAAAMCYTSGTTGNPKGVLYSHRSTLLHSLASAPKDALDVGERDTVMAIVPMFHVNAWGLPYTAALTGAKQVFIGVFSDGRNVARMLAQEHVTITAGVPTIWMGLLAELDRARAAGEPYDLHRLESLVVGGSAAPEAQIRAFQERHGLTLKHAWGMTETHPLGTVSVLPPHVDLRSDEGYALQAKQGRTVPLVQLELLSDEGARLPHDGHTMGRLMARGPWVAASYHKGEGQGNFIELDGQTWFDTGDIATLDARGYMHIQDRSKDLIKSGGEWISSVDLENALMAHPAVAQAAVIAIDDPKWDERPLGVLVLKAGADAPDHAELTAFLAPRFAKWWLPDAYEVVEVIPIGATGKFLKRELRQQFSAYRAPGATRE